MKTLTNLCLSSRVENLTGLFQIRSKLIPSVLSTVKECWNKRGHTIIPNHYVGVPITIGKKQADLPGAIELESSIKGTFLTPSLLKAPEREQVTKKTRLQSRVLILLVYSQIVSTLHCKFCTGERGYPCADMRPSALHLEKWTKTETVEKGNWSGVFLAKWSAMKQLWYSNSSQCNWWSLTPLWSCCFWPPVKPHAIAMFHSGAQRAGQPLCCYWVTQHPRVKAQTLEKACSMQSSYWPQSSDDFWSHPLKKI